MQLATLLSPSDLKNSTQIQLLIYSYLGIIFDTICKFKVTQIKKRIKFYINLFTFSFTIYFNYCYRQLSDIGRQLILELLFLDSPIHHQVLVLSYRSQFYGFELIFRFYIILFISI